jgi:hypothetical protein
VEDQFGTPRVPRWYEQSMGIFSKFCLHVFGFLLGSHVPLVVHGSVLHRLNNWVMRSQSPPIVS